MKPRPFGKDGLFAATALTKIMSGDITRGLTIKPGGAAYDPVSDTLFLPGIPASDLPPHLLDRYLAYLGHEAAERGLSTWKPTDPRWIDKPGLRQLVNAINDARIDLLQTAEYPGWGMKLRAVRLQQAKQMVKAQRGGTLKASYNSMGMLCVFIGEGLLDFRRACQLFPTLTTFLQRGAAVMTHLDLSTEDRCIEHALALYAALQPPTTHDTPPQAPQQNSPTPPGAPVPPSERPDGDDSDSEDAAEEAPAGGGAGDVPGDEGLSADAPDGGPDDDAPADDNGTPRAAPGGARADGQPADSAPDARLEPHRDERLSDEEGPTIQDTLLADIIRETFTVGRPGDRAYTFDPSDDTVRVASSEGGALPRTAYSGVSQVLTTRLRQVLTVPRMAYTRYREKGELDERSIGRFVAGDARVMRQRTRHDDDDIAVTLSWDESYSMSGVRIDTVKRLAYTLNESLGLLSVPTEMLGWYATGRHVRNTAVYRMNPLVHTVYKEFHERWNDQAVLRRLNTIRPSGSTPTAEGLMFAADRLGRRPERRRVLFFLTDGKPGCAVRGNDGPHVAFIRQLVNRAAAVGIELVGFGIGCDIADLFPVSFKVSDIAELRSTASDELVKILKSTKRRVP